jgi:hypothetical protein
MESKGLIVSNEKDRNTCVNTSKTYKMGKRYVHPFIQSPDDGFTAALNIYGNYEINKFKIDVSYQNIPPNVNPDGYVKVSFSPTDPTEFETLMSMVGYFLEHRIPVPTRTTTI